MQSVTRKSLNYSVVLIDSEQFLMRVSWVLMFLYSGIKWLWRTVVGCTAKFYVQLLTSDIRQHWVVHSWGRHQFPWIDLCLTKRATVLWSWFTLKGQCAGPRMQFIQLETSFTEASWKEPMVPSPWPCLSWVYWRALDISSLPHSGWTISETALITTKEPMFQQPIRSPKTRRIRSPCLFCWLGSGASPVQPASSWYSFSDCHVLIGWEAANGGMYRGRLWLVGSPWACRPYSSTTPSVAPGPHPTSRDCLATSRFQFSSFSGECCWCNSGSRGLWEIFLVICARSSV